MFDIGFPELLLAGAIALIVIGPRRLPEAMRISGRWIGTVRNQFFSVKRQIEEEIGFEEMQRQMSEAAAINEIRESGFASDEIVDDSGKLSEDKSDSGSGQKHAAQSGG